MSVEASGEFTNIGAPGHHIVYKAKVEGAASEEELAQPIRHTDAVAEIQYTLRQGVEVVLMH